MDRRRGRDRDLVLVDLRRPVAREIDLHEIGQLLRSWEDVLEERLAETADAGEARRLAQAFGQVVGADYRAANSPPVRSTVLPVARLYADQWPLA